MPEPDIEIEIEDPEEVRLRVGDMEIEIDPEGDDDFNENLADTMDEDVLTDLISDLLSDYDEDVSSRKDWIQTYVDGLELLGMKVEDRTEPWPGACGVYHPLLSEALVKFQAETMMESFPAQGPVKTQVIGKETPEKRDAARRVQDDMNYQLTERMVEYRPEHERMLWGLGLSGNAFKKVYYDPSMRRQVSMYVPAEDVVVPYGASNLETAERVTHVMRKTKNEMKKLQRGEFYRDVDLPEPSNTLDEVEKKIAERMGFRAETDDRYKLLEMQVDLVIEDDKYRDEDDDEVALPYIVTVEKESETVLAIRRNWNPEDKTKAKRNHFVHYSYVPGFGFYAFGLIHLVGAFAKSGTSILRQLVDAGTLSNLPGGFKTKGLRVKGDDTPIAPAEWRDVDVASGTMRDNIMPLPYKEPSQTLYVLLNTIVEEGRKFAGAADLKVSDMSAQAPVGTTLAILERTLKLMSAVQARIHYAMRQEFRLLKGIIRDYTPKSYSYEPEEGDRKAKQSDYDSVDILPVSDPNAATMAQKIVQYQAVIQLAQGAPQIYDLPYLHRQMLEVLGIKNAQKLVPLKDGDDMKPRDPISENMDIINGKPVKAFIYQDHEAHIQTHMAFMQDPKIQKLAAQSPNAQLMGAALQAHIAEHVAFQYRKEIEEQLGVPLPPPDEPLPEDIEYRLSQLVGPAADQLLGKDQAEAQAEKNAAESEDPILQLEIQKLELKKQEMQDKNQREMAKLNADLEKAKLKAMTDENRIKSQERMEGTRLGVEIAKSRSQQSLTAEQVANKAKEAGMRLGMDMLAKQEDLRLRNKQIDQSKPSQSGGDNE